MATMRVALLVVITFASLHENLANHGGPHEETCSAPIRGILDGNITLGFLFPFRGSHQGGSSCSNEIRFLENIQLIEAARFAIQNVQDAIPGVTLGLEAYDTCNSSKVGIEQAVSFLSDRLVLVDEEMSTCPGSTLKAGMMIGGSNDVITSLGRFLSDAHLPTLGYDTALNELTTRDSYSYFARVLPSDNKQATVMVNLIETLGWDYVATFHSLSEVISFEAFKTATNRSSICISKSLSIEAHNMDFDVRVQSLFNELGPKVVVLFLPPNQLEKFFQLTTKYTAPQEVQFIVGHRGLLPLGTPMNNLFPNDTRVLGVLPSALTPNTTQDFDSFFKSLSPDKHDPIANPWFKSYWQTTYQCNLDGGDEFLLNCSADHVQQHMTNYKRHPYVPAILDSIKVFTEALKIAQQALCAGGKNSICTSLQQQSADDFYKNLTQVSTNGAANQPIILKPSGDLATTTFSIVNFNAGNNEFEEVGTWQDGIVSIDNLTQPLVNSNCGDLCLDSACVTNKDTLDKEVYIPGDIIIGGMFNIHPAATEDGPCGEIDETGVQRLEAMLFALDKLNNDDQVLPGVKFGMDGLDTCGNPQLAGHQALQLIANADFQSSGSGQREGAKGTDEHLFAVVGPNGDDECIKVSEVLQTYKMPIVAYAAGGATLSNTYFYPNFARVLAPSTNQISALLGAIFTKGWTYIQAIHSTSQYGWNAVSVLKQQAPQRQICLSQYLTMPSPENLVDDEAWDDIFTKIQNKQEAKVLVIISDNPEEYTAVLDQIRGRSLIGGKYYLMATDGWPANDQEFIDKYKDDIIKGVTFNGKMTRHYDEFKNYFANLNPTENKRNPWFQEYWMNKFDCSLPGTNSTRTPCTDDESIPASGISDVHLADVVDATYTVGKLLHHLHSLKCPGQTGICADMINTGGEEIFNLIRSTAFSSINDDKLVNFDYQGNSNTEFEVFNFQANQTSPSKEFANIKVGSYKSYTYLQQGFPEIQLYGTDGDVIPLNESLSVCTGLCADCDKIDKGKTADSGNGDAYIGGFFRLHELDDNEHDCKDEMIFYNMQYMEAFLYAIDEVNRDQDVLPGIKLGGVAFDTCGSPKRARRDAANFISATVEYRSGYPQNRVVVSGIIGEQTSDVTLALADVVTPLKVPQISYAATTTVLDNNSTYPFFQRTVASDSFQADALIDLLINMDWKYVSVVYSDDEYGNDLYKLISEKAKSKDICIAMSPKTSSEFTDSDFESVVMTLRRNPQAKVVLLLTSDYDTRDILGAAERLGTNDLQWVGTDTWGSRKYVAQNSTVTSQGAITLRFRKLYDAGFLDHYSSLNPYSNTRNPWWKLFISGKYKCNLYGYDVPQIYESTCSWNVNERLAEEPVEPEVAYIIVAVKMYAKGLHDAMAALCPDKTDHLCNEVIENHDILQNMVRAAMVSYNDVSFQFDNNGNGPAMYDILNIQQVGNSSEYVEVGSWDSTNGINLTPASLKFYNGNDEITNVISVCTGRCLECTPPTNNDMYLHLEGQLQIPGLFALHEAGDHLSECGDIRLAGLLNLEAMLYAIDMINKDNTILPGITLGTTAFDTCLRSSRAVRDLSSLLSGSHMSVSTNEIWSSIVGVIGSESEDVSESTSQLTTQYKYTQISYGRGDELPTSDYYLRAGPFASDESKARAIVELLQYNRYNWTYVSVVYSGDDMDIINDVRVFMDAANEAGICIATQQMISKNNTYVNIVDTLFDSKQSNVVIGFLKKDDVVGLQQQVVLKQIPGGLRHLTWILAFPFDLGTEQFIVGGTSTIRSFKGALALKPEEVIPTEFKQYMTSLRVSDNVRNPWFEEYIENTFKCSSSGNCVGTEGVTDEDIDQNGFLIEGVVESVKVIAQGIDNLRKQKCKVTPEGLCAAFLSSNPDEFRDAIRDVTFKRADDSTFRFVDNAVLPTVEVWNYRFQQTETFEKVGHWQPGILELNNEMIHLFEATNTGNSLSHGVPTSECTERSVCSQCFLPTTPFITTPVITTPMVTTQEPTTILMTTSLPPTVMPTTLPQTTEANEPTTLKATTKKISTMKATTSGMTTSNSKGETIPKSTDSAPSIPPLQLAQVGASELTSTWFKVVVIFAAIGMIVTIALILLVFLRWKQPVAQAMSPFLLIMVLLGVLQMFTLVIIFAVPVSKPVCALQRLDSGIGFAVCHAGLLLMTVRLYRMGRHRTISGPKTGFIETGSQIILFTFLAAFQVVMSVEWLILEPPSLVPREPTPTTSPGVTASPLVGDCQYTTYALQCSFIYVYILLILNFFTAIVARRRVSQMLSLSHFQLDTILLATIGSILVMIVWILLGSLIHEDFHRLSISILAALNGYIVLATMFLYRGKILLTNSNPFRDTSSQIPGDYGYGVTSNAKLDLPSFADAAHIGFENPVATTELADFSTSDTRDLIQ